MNLISPKNRWKKTKNKNYANSIGQPQSIVAANLLRYFVVVSVNLAKSGKKQNYFLHSLNRDSTLFHYLYTDFQAIPDFKQS